MAFAEKLKALRQEKGLSQEKLARALKMVTRTYINYEKGRGYPPVEGFSQMADFFNVSMDFLMDKQDAETQTPCGYHDKRGTERLVAEVSGLFTDGELSEAEKDAVMQSLQDAYLKAKNK